MIDEQSSASGHDYALDRSAIGAGCVHGRESEVNHMFTDNEYKYMELRECCSRDVAF